jgi:hypothetical protein
MSTGIGTRAHALWLIDGADEDGDDAQLKQLIHGGDQSSHVLRSVGHETEHKFQIQSKDFNLRGEKGILVSSGVKNDLEYNKT